MGKYGYFIESDEYPGPGGVREIVVPPDPSEGRGGQPGKGPARALPPPPFAPPLAPDTPHGQDRPKGIRHTTGGVTVAIAASAKAVYAIAMDGSLWKWNHDPKQPWRMLPGTPPGARWIAVDPQDGDHLFLGTRNGWARPLELNDAGLWEQGGYDPDQLTQQITF